ncbi:MAG: IS66 family insertion sequence element accessory protein TnpB [Proteobacteria bacterium]|nr:IS66 family insertion sequence element accessory protein TnpB [Pseudomonadota bacterium]
MNALGLTGMRMFVEVPKLYLHREPVDFRKQINGLSVLVEETLQLNPFDEAVFIFINRSRNRLKILYWERNGFCLWLKRLEKDKFAWPRKRTDKAVTLNEEQLQALLSGLNPFQQPHQALSYRSVL